MSDCNVKSRTIFCSDNLEILQGINSDCIDLIYLDPPFNKNKKFTAPIGSSAEGAEFKDIFREEDLKEEWLQTIREDQPDLYQYLNGIKGVGKPYNFAYLAYMAIRLIECRRVLKDTGSIYLHCDPTMSHYLKTTMDCIFGEGYFRNEIIWSYGKVSNSRAKKFLRAHDTLLAYSKSAKLFYNPTYDEDLSPRKQKLIRAGYNTKRMQGLRYLYIYDEKVLARKEKEGKIDRKDFDVIRHVDTTKGNRHTDVFEIDFLNPQSAENMGYPTQKPLALLERVIAAASNKGDVVLDPFCGCATTCVAAEKLDRRWIGIDISAKAYELVQKRLKQEVDKPQQDIFKGDTALNLKTAPPRRDDQGTDYREKKFVYVVSHPNFPGEYKVGIAKNWKSRLNSYQTSDPERQYKMEFKIETPWFRETEQYIHDAFPNKHEWVQGDLAAIIRKIKRYKP